ncbi:MAG: hypothetical protein KF858_11295 [Candidatus Sumerlaeia bacterium]|nr:hypothetical protein [Candidatus Sumerlaeia bacterium]
MLKRLFGSKPSEEASAAAPQSPTQLDWSGDGVQQALRHRRAGEAALPAGGRIACAGIDWNEAEQLALLRDGIASNAAEARAAWERLPSRGNLSLADAVVVHALVAHLQPTRIMEVGCGATTWMLRAGLASRNLPGELITIDPEPRCDVTEAVDAELNQPVQELPRSDFEMLRANEMLVLDLTHVTLPAGEVLYLYQHVLPHLQSGVLVGVRGVRLPLDYTAEERAQGWTEQALLQMFLTGNAGVRVLHAGAWLADAHGQAYREALGGDPAGASWLWYRVC